MGFFDDVPPPPPPPSPLPPPYQPWMGPPRGWLGGFVPVRLTLGRGDDHLVTLGPLEAYPEGISASLAVASRVPDLGHRPTMMDPDGGGHRFGVAYADGRKWQSGMPHALRYDPGADDLVVQWRGGGGGGNEYHMDLWLWPLPPEGTVTFAFEWGRVGIAETLTTVDAGIFRAAAAEAERLWDPLDPIEEAELHARRFAARRGGSFRTIMLRGVENEPEPQDDE
jgi:hypothetical protein